MRETLRVGAGAGFSGDRLEPAAVLAERGRVQYLVLECLGERTVALAQLRRRRDPARGYDPLLERRIESLLPLFRPHGVRRIVAHPHLHPLRIETLCHRRLGHIAARHQRALFGC